jgi:hypothetical protein
MAPDQHQRAPSTRAPEHQSRESRESRSRSRAPEESTTPDQSRSRESRRAGEHQSRAGEQEQEKEQSTGTGSAWLASWHQASKRVFQAYVCFSVQVSRGGGGRVRVRSKYIYSVTSPKKNSPNGEDTPPKKFPKSRNFLTLPPQMLKHAHEQSSFIRFAGSRWWSSN